MNERVINDYMIEVKSWVSLGIPKELGREKWEEYAREIMESVLGKMENLIDYKIGEMEVVEIGGKMNEDVIEKALGILRPLCMEEDKEEKMDAYYIVELDEFGDALWDPVYDTDGEVKFYCIDCIDKMEKKYKLLYPKKEIDSQATAFGENNNFKFCDECGKRLHVSLYVDEQEIEHWEDSAKGKDGLYIGDKGIAFELYTILDEYRFIDKELQPRIIKLAEKIIEKGGEVKNGI